MDSLAPSAGADAFGYDTADQLDKGSPVPAPVSSRARDLTTPMAIKRPVNRKTRRPLKPLNVRSPKPSRAIIEGRALASGYVLHVPDGIRDIPLRSALINLCMAVDPSLVC